LTVDVSIIIVSWNVADLLAACLDSIKSDGRNLEIIVVDSASSDNTVEMVQSRYPHVKLLAQSENVGFTRGNNIGLKVAQGRYLLLLNPDTEVIDDALSKLVAYMDAHPEVGIVGPHTLNTDGSTQSTKRRFPTFTLGFFESTWLQSYAPKSMLDNFYAADVSDTAVADVDWVQGSCLMARREVYAQIGGLDEGYVMFSEELDWCKRAKDAGWRVVYLGEAQIIHHGGKSTEQVTARKHIHFQTSKLRYFHKHHGAIGAFVLRVFLLASYGSQILFEGAKSLIGLKRDMRNERIRAYWQVLRSGLKVN
jgi:N-acetylglucosaminyl-diphospho-decaprenol L-rhamnosyltransferase